MKIAMVALLVAATIGIAAGAPSTSSQVTTGKMIFMQKCAECHGAKLQGIGGPALSGPDFAAANLSISQVRTIVTTQMPLGNPRSLSPEQYAAVIAFILKYDCISPNAPAQTKIGAATCP